MGTVTRIFRNGNSQAVRIPAPLAFADNQVEVEVERIGDELRIRPLRPSLAGAAACFAAFSRNFMAEVDRDGEQAEREAL